MTAKIFIRYLSGRIDITTVGAEKIIPPEKVEKPPKLVPRSTILQIQNTQPNTDWGCRNRALIGVLLDTGMLVSEAISLRIEDCSFDRSYDKTGASLEILGKRARSSRVTAATASALKELAKRQKKGAKVKYFFYGYSKAGPKSEKLSARGVEVLFKNWARSYGIRHLHPRTLRHLFVVDCLLNGVSEAEIIRRISLKTPYAFRVYRTLMENMKPGNAFKSNSKTTYTAEKSPQAEA